MPRSSFSSDEAYYRAAYNAIAQNSCALAQPGSNGARTRSAPSNPGLCNQLFSTQEKVQGGKRATRWPTSWPLARSAPLQDQSRR